MPRRWLLPLAVLAATAMPAHAAAPHTCAGLRGVDLAPARSVKLVERRPSPGTIRFDACVLPNARVRSIASGSRFTNGAEIPMLRAVAGAYAVVTTTFEDQYGDSAWTELVNLRTGARRPLATFSHQLGEPPSEDIGVMAAVVLPTFGGRVAVALLEPSSQTVRVVAYARGGRATLLDTAPLADLPPTSLALAGSTLTWKRDGTARSAALPTR